MEFRIFFLGFYLDEKLTWAKHIEHIRSKVSKGIGIISRARPYLDKETVTLLYYSFVMPYLTYNILAWGSTYAKYIDPLQRLQKRAVRVIAGAKKYDHSQPLFKKYEIMTIKKLHYLETQIFMHRFFQDRLPNIFFHLF